MKMIVTEEIESKTALNRDMYCANCGSHGYEIHHIIEPRQRASWYITCEDCGHEVVGVGLANVIGKWKRDNDNEPKRGIWR